MKRLFLLAAIGTALSGCGDECSSYSNYSCKEIQNATYRSIFFMPDGTEEELGTVKGLNQCSALAGARANEKQVPKQWVCCMVTTVSSCEEKHR